MTDYNSGDIVLVPFPFADLKTNKKRPALVLTSIDCQSFPSLLIVAMITSQLEGEKLIGDYKLKNWEEAGLLHPSKARLAKVVSIEHTLIQGQLGSLQDQDYQAIQKEFKKVFKKWI